MLNPILDHLRRHRVAIACLVIAAGLAVTTFALAGRGAPATPATGPELAIAIVPPVEPDIQPGDVMDVGALNDGFDRAALQRQAPPPLTDVAQPAYVDTAWEAPPPPAPRRVHSEPPREADVDHGYDRPPPPPPPDEYRGDPRAFGFDIRRPDYEAERAERRAMMEARLDAGIRDRFEAERREADWRARNRPPRERYDGGPAPWQARRYESRPDRY